MEKHGSETDFVGALRAGDEDAFEALLERLLPSMRGVARSILSDAELAEDVVQETWIAAIRGLPRFEGRSSLKTWIFAILSNIARKRATRERRTVAFSHLGDTVAETPSDGGCAWLSPSHGRTQTPEEDVLAQEVGAMIDKTLERMPPRQAEIVILRDIEGWSAKEACRSLSLTEANQKVLLHRGRKRIREALERYRSLQPVA